MCIRDRDIQRDIPTDRHIHTHIPVASAYPAAAAVSAPPSPSVLPASRHVVAAVVSHAAFCPPRAARAVGHSRICSSHSNDV